MIIAIVVEFATVTSLCVGWGGGGPFTRSVSTLWLTERSNFLIFGTFHEKHTLASFNSNSLQIEAFSDYWYLMRIFLLF
jgi:hypothetical protein